MLNMVKGYFNPFNPNLIMQILPTIQEENDWVMQWEMIVQSTFIWANYLLPNSPYCMIYLWWVTERENWSWSILGVKGSSDILCQSKKRANAWNCSLYICIFSLHMYHILTLGWSESNVWFRYKDWFRCLQNEDLRPSSFYRNTLPNLQNQDPDQNCQ